MGLGGSQGGAGVRRQRALGKAEPPGHPHRTRHDTHRPALSSVHQKPPLSRRRSQVPRPQDGARPPFLTFSTPSPTPKTLPLFPSSVNSHTFTYFCERPPPGATENRPGPGGAGVDPAPHQVSLAVLLGQFLPVPSATQLTLEAPPSLPSTDRVPSPPPACCHIPRLTTTKSPALSEPLAGPPLAPAHPASTPAPRATPKPAGPAHHRIGSRGPAPLATHLLPGGSLHSVIYHRNYAPDQAFNLTAPPVLCQDFLAIWKNSPLTP